MATDLIDLVGHEQVVFCSDPTTGLRAVIALHSTALGPGLGGTRFHPYPSMDSAVADALRLSRAMSYKNALAGLAHGGGKAVIVGDPTTRKTPDLLRAYGRFVESLGGRYVTACDVGTYVTDMDVIAEETRWATGRSPERGGAGDSSVLTALGVFQGMRAAAQHVWGEPTLAGRRVGIAGVGKVGSRLAEHLLEDGAELTVTDVDSGAVRRLVEKHPGVSVADDAEDLARSALDVFSPNALGGALDDDTVAGLRAAIVCGGANNQLASTYSAERMAARGIVYTPDFLVNAGGVIQVSDELRGFDMERAAGRTQAIFDSTLAVLQAADEDGVSPAVAADRLAEQRIAQGSAAPWLPADRSDAP